jgi:hypothetical protein
MPLVLRVLLWLIWWISGTAHDTRLALLRDQAPEEGTIFDLARLGFRVVHQRLRILGFWEVIRGIFVEFGKDDP